ncbi:MAG: hypothetical protein A2566_01100 [Candidatus Zambryskibacteria bacterium RIFOXYD1_FULL_40_13]|nr:MAG: hypothetical protein UT25_C0001G0209 [Parcubacteria group bacterium GW2011_GWC1_39_12]KKR19733.1 MAG: hypothetical protein UT49_C0001G0209 [Parcubacteria group bacterium GW2011_GWF1_39_37]KKR35889.1 MAG: hypothetical protein UT68_C0001G0212 [Parcubacteria group bacterium GW2011_GWC2_40_10]KKR52701.1 MAG: hypothetical protein UT89_C0001G0209 [Parcubacteria group bacterium GW2011_GWE1_40_20]KKR66481.1 MAG: hypothetical protein UU06_C0001G0014 [Parcubacteria group bacterium GW2011_GWB1_40_
MIPRRIMERMIEKARVRYAKEMAAYKGGLVRKPPSFQSIKFAILLEEGYDLMESPNAMAELTSAYNRERERRKALWRERISRGA